MMVGTDDLQGLFLLTDSMILSFYVMYLQKQCGSAGVKSVGDKWLNTIELFFFKDFLFFLGQSPCFVPRFEQPAFQMIYTPQV